MVSFFGLKIGGEKKKKAESSNNGGGGAQKWKRADQNAMGEGQFFGSRIHDCGVFDGSIREVPSRPGTSHSSRNSPYMLQTHNLAASSMYDLSNVPSTRELRPSASDANLGMRWGNGSSTSLGGPSAPLGSRPGTPSRGRPGTAGGERKRPWVNPLDVHFNRAGSAASFAPSPLKSPLGKFELQVDLGDGSSSLMKDVTTTIESRGSSAVAVNTSSDDSRLAAARGPATGSTISPPPIMAHVNSTSPPALSPLAAVKPHSPPRSFSSSPPRSNMTGNHSLHTDRAALRPNKEMPSGIGPTGLPSPALSQGEGGMDRLAPVPSSHWDMDSGRPIIQNVAAKRDTLTINGGKRQSLSMRIEEFERSLVDAQLESKQKGRSNSGDDKQMSPHQQQPQRPVQMQQGAFGFEDRGQRQQQRPPREPPQGPPPVANANRGPRTHSPMDRRAPPPQRDLGDWNGPERPVPQFASRGPPRLRSPMGRRPGAQRSESPIGRAPAPARDDGEMRIDPPPRNPMRVATPDLYAQSPIERPAQLERLDTSGSMHANGHNANDNARSTPTISTRAFGPEEQSSRPLMVNGPGPMLRGPPRGPGAPRRPSPEEYGVQLPRSNSDREREAAARGAPVAAAAAGAVGGRGGKTPPSQGRQEPLVGDVDCFAYQEPEPEHYQQDSPPHGRQQKPNQPCPPHPQQRPHPQHQQPRSHPYGYRQPSPHDAEYADYDQAEPPRPDNRRPGGHGGPFPRQHQKGGLVGTRQPGQMRSQAPAPITVSPYSAGTKHHLGGNNRINNKSNTLGVFDGPSAVDDTNLSGPPTPDSTNWPLPSPNPISGLTPAPAQTRPGKAAPPSPHNLSAATRSPTAEPFSFFGSSSGAHTPPPQRSMTTPVAACDEPARPKTAGGGAGTIGMARGLSLRYERERNLVESPGKSDAWGPQPGTRRPNHGLKAPTGIADSFGTGFI